MDRLAHYTIVDKIGQGGMGEVFRAQDTRLGREVAIKVLPDAFVEDAERLARFEREARVLASLQHANVASIFGLEQDGKKRFLVLELVPGEDLAKRLERGAVAVDDTIAIASQIAAAVEAAHELGIVHRDLKPSNVMLTPEGDVKVLDFGLAKAAEGDLSDSSLDLTHSPTRTSLLTEANVILGTAGYMSPEQARGKKVDKRADIWAFGVILFEMLAGGRLFDGETVSDTLASVLKVDPDWDRLPADTPPHVRRLLERCLDRDPRTRLRDIGEARIVLAEGEGATAPTAQGRRRGIRLPFLVATAVACLALGAAAVFLLRGGPPAPVQGVPRMVALEPGPGDAPPTDPVISPDGTRVAYIRDGSIWVRDLGTLEPRHLERTKNAIYLFWSPRSDRIGYLTGDKVMTVDPVEGAPVVVAATGHAITENSGAGGTWSPTEGILFARGHDNVFRVAEGGGEPTVYVARDTTRENDIHEPSVLPDGGLLVVPHFLSDKRLSTLEIRYGNERIPVTETPGSRIYRPVWSPTGHILYERREGNPGVWAIPWDLAGRHATGEPFLVFPNGTFPSVAGDGTLVLLQGAVSQETQIVEADRTGKILRRIGDAQVYGPNLSLAPDGNRLAVVRQEEGSDEIWISDLARGTESRLTFFRGYKSAPEWSPDGRLLAYYLSHSAATLTTVVQPADGGGKIDTLAAGGTFASFVPGTNDMIFTLYNTTTGMDLFTGPETPGGKRTPLVGGTGWQYAAHVSPDRKYVAYVSDESGVSQVFLKRYPDGSGKWQVSIESGEWPHWTAAGDHLLYVRGDDVMDVTVKTSDPPVLGRPQLLFARQSLGFLFRFGWQPDFAMNGDATRFYFLQPEGERQTPVKMVLYENWVRAFQNH